jgi:hypothetical protein
MAGFLAARLPDVGLGRVSDPRGGPVKWKLASLVTACLVGLMAGCKSLREVELFSEMLSPAVRRKLRLGGRLPDTTLRDLLCQLSLEELRGCLHRTVKAAQRRKALVPMGLPFGVLAMDGKATAVPYWDSQYVQKHQPEVGLPFGLARTVTCTLVRMYVTSLREEQLSPAQWLLLIRSHWGVESNHHTLDTAFKEDDHPWIVADGQGLMNVLLLRRIAYTLLALFRAVTLRSDDNRAMRWGDLLRWVYATLIAATEEQFHDLRPRKSINAVCA